MPDDELSPEQERVRALLAQARVDTPVPDDVAARLDRVLAQLASGSTEEGDETPAGVVDLASRRRRRKAATLLIAAAAVVAVGIGIGNVMPSPMGASDSAADRGAEAPAEAAVEDGNGPLAAAPSSGANDGLTSSFVGEPSRVRPERFADDVERLRPASAVDAEQAPSGSLSSFGAPSPFMCDDAAWGPGRLVAVYYAGVPAVLAFRPPVGDTQVVDLLECGTAVVLRSLTLPLS